MKEKSGGSKKTAEPDVLQQGQVRDTVMRHVNDIMSDGEDKFHDGKAQMMMKKMGKSSCLMMKREPEMFNRCRRAWEQEWTE
jgi:hypothetical protein